MSISKNIALTSNSFGAMEVEHQVKKRKRGIAQRLAEERAAHTYESKLAELLIRQLAWGIFTTAQIQDIADQTVEDLKQIGVDPGVLPALDSLSKSGSHGKHPNNIHRDVMKCAKDEKEFKPLDVHVPFENIGEQPTKINLPHEHFAHMYNTHPEAFKQQMLPNLDDIEKFWTGIQGHPAVEKLQGEDLRFAVPLGMHGDEVPITGVGKCWAKLALTFQYFSLLSLAAGTPTLNLLQWLWATFDNICVPGINGTVHTFMTIMKWSFFWLKEGKWPTHDWKGTKHLLLH